MFIDIVDQAFVHQMMMSVWRESEAVLDASSSLEDGLRRLREVGDFGDRGRFAPIWQKNWEEALGEIREADSPPERLEAVRGAVVKSIDEENEARFEAGLPPVIDGQEGQDFIDYTLDRIIEDASGEIEDDLEDEPDEI